MLESDKNNPLDLKQANCDIEIFANVIAMGAVSGRFLDRLCLESAKEPHNYRNREPLFYMEQVTRHPNDRYIAAIDCMHSDGCWAPDPLPPSAYK
jgi:hypothetical protein